MQEECKENARQSEERRHKKIDNKEQTQMTEEERNQKSI